MGGGIGQQPSYTALPQQYTSAGVGTPRAAANAVNVKGRTLDQLVEDFAKSTGSDEAELRIAYDQGNVHFIVPSSADGKPSLWTKFKAALSDLPLFNRVASLRAAKLEVDSLPLEADTTLLVIGLSHAIDNTERAQGLGGFGFKQSVSDDARTRLTSQPLTKRHVVQVLSSAIDGINQRREDMASKETTMAVPSSREPAVESRRPAAKNARAGMPAWLRSYVGYRNHDLFEECAKTVATRIDPNDKARIGIAAQKLYGHAQDFLTSQGNWPLKDVHDQVMDGFLATLDLNYGDD